MGKKNRKSSRGDSDTGGSMPRAQSRAIMELVNSLLDKCSYPASGGPKDWDDYLQIHDLVEKIRAKQKGKTIEHYKRDENIEEFMEWCKSYEINLDSFTIENFGVTGLGLKAKHDIKKSESFVSIPRKAMMTTEAAKKSALGLIMERDRILQAMPNVLLALYVLCERLNKQSAWTPYFKILPSRYTTTLYFSTEDLLQLKGSPVFYDALNQYRNIARQYAYFYRLFQGSTAMPDVNKLPLHQQFCFDDYRWAVSTVMTRQNQIPSEDGSQVVTALIPLWDMCNHENGEVTTGYDPQTNCSECFAQRDFKMNEQIFIFYGARSNADLLLHNGFVYQPNENDSLSLKLGISKNDPLFAMKAEVLARLGFSTSRTFQLDCGENPVGPELLSFLRVFCMGDAELKCRLIGEHKCHLVEKLGDINFIISEENEKKVWSFLQMRATLLLKCYPTSIEDDKKIMETTISEETALAVTLRIQEKQLLKNAISYAQQQTSVEKKLVDLSIDNLDETISYTKDVCCQRQMTSVSSQHQNKNKPSCCTRKMEQPVNEQSQTICSGEPISTLTSSGEQKPPNVDVKVSEVETSAEGEIKKPIKDEIVT